MIAVSVSLPGKVQVRLSALEFTSTLIGQLLSWPIAVVILVFALRKPIAELLSKLREYEGMGQKLSFGDRLAQAEDSVEKAAGSIEQPPGKQLESPAEQKESDESSALIREAEANPSYVLLTSWERLNGAIDDLLGSVRSGTREGFGRSVITQFSDLRKSKFVKDDFLRAVAELRELRNRVAHGQHNPSPGEALAYAESAEELRRAAHALARTIGPRAFVSFDFDHNQTEKNLFAGQARNASPTSFTVQDWSNKSSLPQSRWEAEIKKKIARTNLCIVLVGTTMASATGVAKEISMAKEQDVPVFGVYLGGAMSNSTLPTGLDRSRTVPWDWDKIAAMVDQCMTEGKNNS